MRSRGLEAGDVPDPAAQAGDRLHAQEDRELRPLDRRMAKIQAKMRETTFGDEVRGVGPSLTSPRICGERSARSAG